MHGTAACYAWGPEPGCLPGRGCRCDLCADARREYEKKRRQRAEPAYVSAGPVREHLAFLSARGIGWKHAARAAGLSPSVVWKIVYGRDGKPSKRCRPETASKLLAVTPADGAAGSLVDAAATWRNIERLLAAGWTKSAIARAIGQSRTLQVSRSKVERGTASKIESLLGQPVPDDVGRAWSEHHKATVEVEEPEPVVDDRDRFILDMVELLEARIDQTWRKRAACRGKPPWMFFPARGDHKTVKAAKAVCATCPVSAECLEANRGEREGVYGGTSARERRTSERVA